MTRSGFIRLLPPCLCVLTLLACAPEQLPRAEARKKAPEISCLTRPGCHFDRAPVRVLDEPVRLPNRAYVFFPVAEPLTFVDARGQSWRAPERTLTDGASIPPIFTAIVGQPTAPEYINAAALHDAYCGVGNEGGPMFHRADWRDVHQMFYDGLIAGGTRPKRAKVMFAAVWLGGPRWPDGGGGGVLSTQGVVAVARDNHPHDLAAVPVPQLQEALRRTIRHIEARDPSLPELLEFLSLQEREMLRAVAQTGGSERRDDSGGADGGDDGGDHGGDYGGDYDGDYGGGSDGGSDYGDGADGDGGTDSGAGDGGGLDGGGLDGGGLNGGGLDGGGLNGGGLDGGGGSTGGGLNGGGLNGGGGSTGGGLDGGGLDGGGGAVADPGSTAQGV
jgi:hypothetical protein